MQCGTYYINKDDLTMLDDRAFLDESRTAVSNDTVSTGLVHMQTTSENQPVLNEKHAKNPTDLWQFLEEAISELHLIGPEEPIVFQVTCREMLKDEDILSQIIGEPEMPQIPFLL